MILHDRASFDLGLGSFELLVGLGRKHLHEAAGGLDLGAGGGGELVRGHEDLDLEVAVTEHLDGSVSMAISPAPRGPRH